MFGGKLALAAVATVMALAGSSPAAAQRTDYGPFYVLDQYPDTIILNGPLVADSGRSFSLAIARHPALRYVGLAGGGGSTSEALILGEQIRGFRLETYVFEGFDCAMPCPLLFFAGVGRTAHGGLGLARLASAPTLNRLVEQQLGLYGTPESIIAAFRGLADGESRAFTAGELTAMGANWARDDALAAIPPLPDVADGPVPDTTIPPIRIGDYAPTSLIVVQPDGSRLFFEALIQWATFPDPAGPGFRAGVRVDGLPLAIQINILAYLEQQDFVGTTFTMDFWGGDGQPPQVPPISVDEVAVIKPDGDRVHVPMVWPSVGYGGVAANFPLVLQPYLEELLTAAATIEITILWENGIRTILILPIDEAARAALVAVIADWHD